jgi:hypothetical protein
MFFQRTQLALFIGLIFCMISPAQTPTQVVQWSASTTPNNEAKRGSKISIQLSAEIQDGWHVYGLAQVSGGPTPLRVALEDNEVIRMDGATKGSAVEKKRDPSFDLETQFYTHSFVLQVPAQVKLHSVLGRQAIPVSVRFQACSERTCLPPRTVQLSVPIEVLAGN